MSKPQRPNLARILYDAYPHSDLLPLDPDADCRDLRTLIQQVIGDGLFRFLVIEIVEGGESTLDGAIRVVTRARNDVEAVLEALIRARNAPRRRKESHHERRELAVGPGPATARTRA